MLTKDEELELIRTAMEKLEKLASKPYGPDTLDNLSFIFNVFIKNMYNIRHECTKEEIVHVLSRKNIDSTEKEIMAEFAERLEYLKYFIAYPDPNEVRELISLMIRAFELKYAEVNDDGIF